MDGFRLFGTVTSPFVRRVRVVATELSVPYTLIDTTTEAGQAELRQASPIWKVPTATFKSGGPRHNGPFVVWDSHAIIDHVVSQHGWPFRPVIEPHREQQLCLVLDEVLTSGIKLFYLQKDGVDTRSIPSCVKDEQRLDSMLQFACRQVRDGFVTEDRRFGMAELFVISTMSWLAFRKVVDVAAYPALMAVVDTHANRASVMTTAPG